MNIPIPPIEFMDKSSPKLPNTPPISAPISRSNSNSTLFQAQLPIGKAFVNLVKPAEPPVTYLEVLKFLVWGIMVVLTQLWRDLSSGTFYKPLLSTDFMTHYFVSPVAPWKNRSDIE